MPKQLHSEMDTATQKAFGQRVFQDHRWDNAMDFLRGLEDWGPERAQGLLCEGAGTFGIWHLSEASIQSLVGQLLGREPAPSPAISGLAALAKRAGSEGRRARRVGSDLSEGDGPCKTPSAARVSTPGSTVTSVLSTKSSAGLSGRVRRSATMSRRDVDAYKSTSSTRSSIVQRTLAARLNHPKMFLSLLICIIANAYAIKVVTHMYPDALRVFGWPIYFARMGAMAAVLWTAVLYLTMARGFLTRLYPCAGGRTFLVAPLDAHKDVHIMAGASLLAYGIEHTVAHLIGTVPGILAHDADELNELLGCANRETTPDFIDVDFGGLQWPGCPLRSEDVPSSVEGILFATMPGLTGILLLVLLSITAYTGRVQGRKQSFDVFWYVHNATIFCWPVLLFVHGSNSWIGVGFPLVVFAAGLPLVFYIADRTMRLLRFYLYGGTHVRIARSLIRPGKGEDPADGALTYLEVTQPPALWRFQPGMYAFICMPDYAPLQWHPFTICSGTASGTVDFLIAGVGDWTRELAKRCLAAEQGLGPLPRVALDGPYTAPTQSALHKKVLVAVGAGVGITPFLSLMSTIISCLDSGDGTVHRELQEVHFYWMSRSAEEFLFGRKHFATILHSDSLKEKVFFHLHVTGKPPDKHPAGFVFREAVKRQSRIDRQAFAELAADTEPQDLVGPLMPWCWENGATDDVLWVDRWQDDGDDADPETSSDPRGKGIDSMLPLIFSRPDFATEIRSIGKSRTGRNVHVYICGNDAVVQNLSDIVEVCNKHAAKDTEVNGTLRQRYFLHFERFG